MDTAARPGQIYRGDDEKMAFVIRLARENVNRGTGGPFGAAIFELEAGGASGLGAGWLVAAGVNSVARLANCVLHAEIMAIMLAQQRVGSFTLHAPGGPAYELITSCEPCAMCLGATLYSGVSRLVIGATRDDATAIGFDEGPVFTESYAYLAERGVVTVRDVRRGEAASVIRAYREGGGPIYTGDVTPSPRRPSSL